MQHPSTTIIHGPQACGKTRNAKALADHFGCTSIVDSWDGCSPLPAGALALTHEPPPYFSGPIVLQFDEACRLAGIKGHGDNTVTTQDAMLYAVAHDADGSALELTVFEDGQACSVRLTKPLIDQLVHALTHHSQ